MQNRTPLLGLIAVAGAGIFVLTQATNRPLETAELTSDAPEKSEAASSLSRPLAAGSGGEASAAQRALITEAVEPEVLRVLCLSAANRTPVPGVQLYQGLKSIAGPTADDGVLSIEEPGFGKRTLWAAGWVPQVHHSPALPAEVLMVRADAALEVRLINFSGDHRVLRTLLQPRNLSVPVEGSWMPVLSQAELDTLVVQGTAPGAYDLYVWITYEYASPKAYHRVGIELTAGEQLTVEIDINAPLDGSSVWEEPDDH